MDSLSKEEHIEGITAFIRLKSEREIAEYIYHLSESVKALSLNADSYMAAFVKSKIRLEENQRG